MSKTTTSKEAKANDGKAKEVAGMLKLFNKARIVGTPLVAITTPDNAATVNRIKTMFNGHAPALVQWDVAQGASGVNQDGEAVVVNMGGSGALSVGDCMEILTRANELPEDAVLFMFNLHLFLDNPAVLQAVWNLRDTFKAHGRTLVVLAPQITLPTELQHDFLVLDEAMPTLEELADIVTRQYNQARDENPDMPTLAPAVIGRAVDALAGLAAYPAESSVALSLTKRGLDLDALWERKRRIIAQTNGLSIYQGKETFDDIAGLENAKTFGLRLVNGKRRPRAVVWFDEFEKMMAGFGGEGGVGDTSGTTQDQMGQLLEWMQENDVRGLLYIGFPGSGKSLMAKALGNTAGVPTIKMDLGAMKGSLVGQSEERIRTGLKVASAIGQGEILVVATCNSVGNLPPEIRRRFKRGTFFYDLCNATERAAAWRLHLAKSGLEGDPANLGFSDEGWTGAEIETCCDMAAEMGFTLAEAATYVVPVCKSMGEKVNAMREQAHGRYISASKPGIYEHNAEAVTTSQPAAQGARKVRELAD